MYHTEKWWKQKYIEMRYFAERRGIDLNQDRLADLRSLPAFKAMWEKLHDVGVKDISAQVRYAIQHKTDYNTALTVFKRLKETHPDVKFKDVQDQSTREIAEKYLDEYKNDVKNMGKGLANLLWWGSD